MQIASGCPDDGETNVGASSTSLALLSRQLRVLSYHCVSSTASLAAELHCSGSRPQTLL